ncbi:MAG: diaminopimelate epimerase [Bacteroidota bacterium]|nr:diaminopimelate epimerase [Bacteroidota bacterium]
MKISFTKMSGAGNDFVVVDNRNGIITDPHQFTIAVCNRRLGIGADGVLLVETSNIADFTMRYYNADGTDAGMCGNGGRCIAKFAFDNGIVSKASFKFEALGYVYESSRINSTLYELKMKNPADYKPNQEIKLDKRTIKGNYLNTGTDHSVIFMEDNPEIGELDTADVFNLGRSIRYDKTYQPKGTNVNFVSKIDPNNVKIRTYERGVEDETLACGTGSVASALLSSTKFQMKSPVKVKVLSGAILEISFEKKADGSFSNVILKGPAENVFKGTINVKNSFDIAYE